MVIMTRSSFRFRIVLSIGIVSLLLLIGTLFYHFVEGWSGIDAFYFSSMSLSTRGISNLVPETVVGKLFTSFYLFVGVALVVYLFSTFVAYYMEFEEKQIRQKMESVARRFSKNRKWVVIKEPAKKRTFD